MHVILSSAAVVVASILVYDRVFRASDDVSRDADLAYDEATGGPGAADGGRDPRFALTARMADQDRRLGNLEAELEALRSDVARVAKLAEEAASREERRPDPDAPLDEDELDVLRLQMEELARRREAKRQATMVQRKLEQLGVTFTEAEHAAVKKRMVDFQVAVAELWTRVRENAIQDQGRIAEDYTALTDAAARDLRALLPAEKAQAVIAGFLRSGPPGHRPPR